MSSVSSKTETYHTYSSQKEAFVDDDRIPVMVSRNVLETDSGVGEYECTVKKEDARDFNKLRELQ